LKATKPYEIAFIGLPNGEHAFEFALNDGFFSIFGTPEFDNAQLNGKLILHKKSNRLDLEFFVDGRVNVNCDRCLENFWQDVAIHKMLYIKFGDRNEEQSDDIIIIPSTDSHINVAQYFYEFVLLGMPQKKTHSNSDTGEPLCDPKILNKLNKHSAKRQKEENNDNNKPADSRWDPLKKLKFNN